MENTESYNDIRMTSSVLPPETSGRVSVISFNVAIACLQSQYHNSPHTQLPYSFMCRCIGVKKLPLTLRGDRVHAMKNTERQLTSEKMTTD